MDFSAIGRQLGLDEQQTRAAFEALAPVVAAGMRQSSQAGGGGLAEILGSLGGGNPQRYAEDESSFASPGARDDGNAILGQIFGSKDVSRGVAQQLSASSGIGESILKKLLPIVAAYVMSQIASKAANGGLGDILGSILGGGQSAPQRGQTQQGGDGGLGDILGSVLGGGSQSQGGGGGLGDILGGILGGGQQAEEPAPRRQAPSGGLDDILRDVLGGGNQGGRSNQGSSGNAADDLLRSVQDALRQR